MRLIRELGYLGFEVSDIHRWGRFASEVLGMVVDEGPVSGSRYLRMDDHRYRLLLTQGPADDCVFAGWNVADPNAVAAFADHLERQGVPWTWATDAELSLRAVEQMLHFSDPAGNRHEVYCGPALASGPFASPALAGQFVTRNEGLGHIVYSSGEYGRTVAFAQEVLGLSISDRIQVQPAPGIDFEVTFMHANGRHHSYAIAPRHPGPGPHKQMHHFMVEVMHIEDVGLARDRCLAIGQQVTMDIGQHPNDRMISFYGQTPSGFQVEFGCGGVKVDEANWKVAKYDRLSNWGHKPHAAHATQPAKPRP